MKFIVAITFIFLVWLAVIVWWSLRDKVAIDKLLLLIVLLCGAVILTIVYSVIFLYLGADEDEHEYVRTVTGQTAVLQPQPPPQSSTTKTGAPGGRCV